MWFITAARILNFLSQWSQRFLRVLPKLKDALPAGPLRSPVSSRHWASHRLFPMPGLLFLLSTWLNLWAVWGISSGSMPSVASHPLSTSLAECHCPSPPQHQSQLPLHVDARGFVTDCPCPGSSPRVGVASGFTFSALCALSQWLEYRKQQQGPSFFMLDHIFSLVLWLINVGCQSPQVMFHVICPTLEGRAWWLG